MSAILRDNSCSEQSLQIRSQLNGLITEIQNNPYHWPNAYNAFPYPPCHDIHIHLLQSLNDNHSCLFFVFQKRQSFILAFFFVFLKLSHKKTTASLTDRTCLRARSDGVSIFSWNTDQHMVHTPTHSLEGT